MKTRNQRSSRAIVSALSLVSAIALAVAALVPGTTRAEAVAATDFNAGNIISDVLFYDGQAMNSAEIQQFLNSRVPRCTIGDPGRLAGSAWGSTTIASHCLRDFRVATASRAANLHCSAYAGSASETASEIIAKVGRACGISPKVLLVMLEKEQSLVTDSWPTTRQFDYAMGYACPDSGPNNSANCDPSQTGFFNQVYRAAWQLKVYRAFPSSYNYKPFQVNTIQWHPNVSCGTSQVFIENWATAALYIYTPYRPNQAALNAGWGLGDPCSAYGNRNFYLYFKTWFGLGQPASHAAIESKWAQNKWLGTATSDFVTFDANGGGTVRAYENGAITWTAATGAVLISGPFRTFYNSRGGVAGSLGWPAGDLSERGSGRQIQGFTKAAIAFTPENGFATLSGQIRNYYNSAAFSLDGPLGWPTGEPVCPDPNTCSQTFEYGNILQTGNQLSIQIPEMEALIDSLQTAAGTRTTSTLALSANGGGFVIGLSQGAVTWTRTSGAQFTSGEIRGRFNALGGINGALGWPVSSETCLQDSLCFQDFDGGALWTSGTQVFRMTKEISNRYLEVRALGMPIGTPIGDSVLRSTNGGGHVQAFTNGAMTWSSRSGAVLLTAPVRGPYNALGGLDSAKLGWPLVDAVTSEQGTIQEFERASLAVAGNGQVSLLSKDISHAYLTALGGPTGTLGWPIGSTNAAMSTNGMGSVQGFEGGALVSFPGVGTLSLHGSIRALYNSRGGLSGPLGWPTTNETFFPANGGGRVQGFENAAILASNAGTYVLTGGIRQYYNSLGSFSGSLGWPVSDQTCDNGICTQRFQGGILTWSPSSGGTRS